MSILRGVAALLVLLPLPALAQETARGQPAGPALATALQSASQARLWTGRRVLYVRQPRLDSGVVRFAEVLPAAAVPAQDTIHSLPLAEISRIEIRVGTQAARGAGVGAILGLALAAASCGTDYGACSGDSAGSTVGSFLFSTSLFAGVGALIGLTMPRWRVIL